MQASADKKIYHTVNASNEWTNDSGWGWEAALSTEQWEADESLRAANSVHIEVTAVGSLSQAPTSRAPTILSLLHQNLTCEPRSLFCFTAFDRRKSRRQIEGRKLLADKGIMSTCPVLYDSTSFAPALGQQ